LTIEPAVLHLGLVQRSRQPRPFSGMDAFFGRTELKPRILETESVAVQVKELPLKPSGAPFSGLVGRFEIDASLDKSAIPVGDSTTLAITVRGSGNIMDAAAPKISVPAEFKTYTDNPEEKIQLGPEGYTGSKTFRTALVPVEPGQYRVEPVHLAYFDVEAGQYRVLSTVSFDVTASPSETSTTDIDVFRASPAQALSMKKRVEFTGRDIFPIKTSLIAVTSKTSLSIWWFGLLLLIPFMVFILTMAIVRGKRKDDSPGRIMADKARNALKSAGSAGTSDADFLTALYRALVSAVNSKKGVEGTSLTWSEVKKQLTEIGWEKEDAAETAKLLETIESFNYSGSTLDEKKRAELFEKTKKAVRRLTR